MEMAEGKRRLIDAGSFDREAQRIWEKWDQAMAGADGKREIHRVFRMQELFRAVQYVGSKMPTIDAVEVVRCKDCKFCMQSQVLRQHRCYCPQKSSHVVSDDGYCSFGVRKS